MLYIFKLSTVSVTVTTESVIYNLNCKCWKNLPKEGFILLTVSQSVPATADALPVSIAATNALNTIEAFSVPVINGAGDPVTSAEITQGNKYFLYFNKCNGIFQMVNYIPATA